MTPQAAPPPSAVNKIVVGRHNDYRIDSLIHCRTFAETALESKGVTAEEMPGAWSKALEAGMNELAAWMVSIALKANGLEPAPATVEIAAPVAEIVAADTSHHPGIDRHRGNYRARCWSRGKIIFCREFKTIQQAIHARNKFLATFP